MKTIGSFLFRHWLALFGAIALSTAVVASFFSAPVAAQVQTPRSLTRVILEVGGKRVGTFVSAEMGSETEVLVFTENNITVKRPGRTKYSNIVLKRGFTATDDLWQWRKQIEAGVLDRRAGSIILVEADTLKEVTRYNFYEGWPAKWYVPDMDSDQSGMAVEKIEIAVEKIERP